MVKFFFHIHTFNLSKQYIYVHNVHDARVQLYDLMTMAFKYQIALCPRPRDLLLVSFNHMDGIRELVKDNPRLVNLINDAQRLIIEVPYNNFTTLHFSFSGFDQ